MKRFLLEGAHIAAFGKGAPELHREVLQQGYEEGRFLVSGPSIPLEREILIARAAFWVTPSKRADNHTTQKASAFAALLTKDTTKFLISSRAGTLEDANDQIDRCCWPCVACRDIGERNESCAPSSDKRDDHASRVWLWPV
jgi:uncharacterized protein YciI